MATELMKDIYRLEVPLPKNPLKLLNSYLIKGKERNLLIDTGFNRPECEAALMSELASLEVDFNKTDIFITHLHADHSGLLFKIKTDNNTAYCQRLDAAIVNRLSDPTYWDYLADEFIKTGLRMSPELAVETHPGWLYRPNNNVDFTYIENGDKLVVGRYTFTCIYTPGHSPGHMCLYEENEKILFAGDMILGDITPNLCIELYLEYPLTDYLESLDKVEKLDIKHIFVGHRSMLKDVYGRIKELREHHAARCQEALMVLESGPLDAWEAAEKMTWDIQAKDWNAFPPSQKWFATGEAQAHLLYLWQKGKVRRKFRANGVNYFELEDGVPIERELISAWRKEFKHKK
ncbi:hydroxyacylglutathione hydrolase [Pelotomaculum schinkii]|uniref:Hydroxyacylglutathione hydrolase n=1 Tax=Pelotomaculum schinkii TaxID=78350 RepID=A0A4Y7RI20_9FIRM|nr:MBL fold metallo-hydrolase [Pelotomaculum schinkii]TEB07967.1 hydroxyacylglutathione hydrolase [Pelotomaculum schinkii]